MNNLILTDVDGVLLNWEYGFDCWMGEHGHRKQEGYQFKYDIGKRYGSMGNAHSGIEQMMHDECFAV